MHRYVHACLAAATDQHTQKLKILKLKKINISTQHEKDDKSQSLHSTAAMYT